MSKVRLFTSESVSEGHPDKVADQISDAIVDALLEVDPQARIACETLVKTGMVLIAGEITSEARVDYTDVARHTLHEIGYGDPRFGYPADEVSVSLALSRQSPDIAQGVNPGQGREQGAGDQGIMFGFACDETDALMPAPIELAHRLVRRQAEVRKSGVLPWLGPDAKSQVTLRYQDGEPVAIDAVVLSTQHVPDITLTRLRREVREYIMEPVLQDAVREEVIKPVQSGKWLNEDKIYINPTGCFVNGGPVADCGLTGRKIIADTYGGMAHHGGGAFSGKDPSKVDRSAAYAARHVARNLVAAGLLRRCEVQLSYAIGVAQPVAVNIDGFGSGSLSEERLERLVEEHFDLSPAGIIEALNLKRPIYRQTAAYGHFGRGDLQLPWECTDRAAALRAAAGCD